MNLDCLSVRARRTLLGARLAFLLLVTALLPGCVTAIKSDKIVSVKTRVFGISVGTNPINQVPEIKLGLVTTVYQMVPTSTNGTLNAPRYFDTFSIGQGVNPFSTQIIENTGTGDVAIGTNATGTAIIPKAPVKPVPPQ